MWSVSALPKKAGMIEFGIQIRPVRCALLAVWEGLAFRVNIVVRVVAINAALFLLCKRCGIAIVVEGPSSDRRRRVFLVFVNALCLIWRKSCFNWYCSHTQNGAQFC